TYETATDDEALAAFRALAETEGILPALEPSHALAYVLRSTGGASATTVLVGLSGRGDKDVGTIAAALGAG
ncbi:MAG: tryptophan synthase subunit beta, partial [Actinomycetota bacterium]|nr:tryptophan synthase subunit beta [Actinomycetota bacterium]